MLASKQPAKLLIISYPYLFHVSFQFLKVSPRGVTKGLLRISDEDYDHYANYGNDNYGDANNSSIGISSNISSSNGGGSTRRGSGGMREAPAARPGAAQRALAPPPLMEEDHNEVRVLRDSHRVFLLTLA